MSEYTKAVLAQLERIESAEKAVATAVSQYATVKQLNGQSGYSVVINGVRVDVADQDPKTYQAKMIRGREMIHLGALKSLDALIDQARARLKGAQVALAALTSAGGVV